ncbi:hypothetical protein DPMN_106276 [Dreissena polymorpha]|uniref:G-protein coupled receptors family 1 profile domain-containing protein n=1 Tax=Dreissena polymorpha TaxID=45954 RepID=A0A9D4QJK6_DREPO|nr:hypothetical protein DPMN_106276 [Dreissena polymorpha]
MNAIVLTKRHMTTPTNYILTALAVVDCLQMLTYPVYAIYSFFYTQKRLDANHSQGWIYCMVVLAIFLTTCHNMALWFTVSLAVFRYIFVCHHGVGDRLCSLQRALLTI